MVQIKTQLKRLSENDKKSLMIAFEQFQSYYVKLPDQTFVGVHLTIAPNLIIEDVGGYWSAGRLK